MEQSRHAATLFIGFATHSMILSASLRVHDLLVINDRKKELSFRKLLDWLWWKSAFT